VRKTTKDQDVVFSPGTLRKHKLSFEEKHLAMKTAEAIDTRVVRVDMASGKDPYVVNIGLNPDLVEASKVTGVNIAREIMKRVHDDYTRHKDRPMLVKFFDDAKSVVKDVLKEK
jgi:hypothetical protein